MEDWVKIPQSKEIFFGGFQYFIASHLIQHVKSRQKTEFQVNDLHSLKDTEEDQKRTGYRYPSLKIVFGGIFEVGSVFHLNQHVKLRQETKYRVSNVHSLKDRGRQKGLGTGTPV